MVRTLLLLLAAILGTVVVGCDGSQPMPPPAAEKQKAKILAPGEKSGDVQIHIDK
jgi:hypothetical protein